MWAQPRPIARVMRGEGAAGSLLWTAGRAQEVAFVRDPCGPFHVQCS